MIIKLVLWYVKNLILNTKVKQVSQQWVVSATVAISDKNLQFITCTRLTAVIDTQVLTTRQYIKCVSRP